ncbi:DUF4352 domain-containing protein [Clostridium tertium]|uniref:DUF4352 domain-containing protein n=1 Tax=Clostridium tertium TaxID=1559 RepID=A0A6N3GVA1_9CLOT
MNKKRVLSALLITLTTFTFISCGGNDESGNNNSEKAPIPREDFNLVYSNPKEYEGREVEFYGKIFTDIEKDNDGTYMQMFTNETGSDNNVLVGIKDPNLNVKIDDIVHVKGIVKGVEKGTNAFGAELNLPLVLAESVEITDYGTAYAPALKTIDINQEQNQFGYKLTLKKVEISKSETRAYVKIENASNDKVNFYSFNSMITQGTNQIEQEDNWEANYQEISSEILPGIVTEGVITFKPIDINGGDFNIIFEGYSDDYSLDFTPFTFQIKMN